MKIRIPLLLLALALCARSANAVSIGGEAYGGMSLPILQPTSDQGKLYGVRVPVHLIPLLTLEPYYQSSTLGDKTETIGGAPYTRDGGKVTAYGANARLGGLSGPGLSIFPYVGVGSHKFTRAGASDQTNKGYNIGLGIQLSPVAKLGIDLRGELNAIVTGSTSQKFANVTLGVAYNFLSLP